MKTTHESSQKHQIGQVIAGRYRLDRMIARGGMGLVFLATQMPLGRQVAIKLLLPQTGDKDFRKRFLLEASISAQLVQRHIVTVHDFGESEDGSLYMAMEYLDGDSLAKVITREFRIDSPRTCKLAMQMCRALRAAHAKGVVHRDLKPSNIMLLREEDDEGHTDFVKVLDFGLGKIFETGMGNLKSTDLTGAGALLGSPNYMAPEQIRCTTIDPRTDIYALGVIMFHMLAGRPPFLGPTSIEVMNAHLSEAVPSIGSILGPGDDVAPELEVIVQRAMEKNPYDRYQSMDDLLSDLKAAHRLIAGEVTGTNLISPYGTSEIVSFQDLLGFATPPPATREMPPAPPLQAEPHQAESALFREALLRGPTALETVEVALPVPAGNSAKKRAIAIGVGLAGAGLLALFAAMFGGRSSPSPEPVVAAQEPIGASAAIAMPQVPPEPAPLQEVAPAIEPVVVAVEETAPARSVRPRREAREKVAALVEPLAEIAAPAVADHTPPIQEAAPAQQRIAVEDHKYVVPVVDHAKVRIVEDDDVVPVPAKKKAEPSFVAPKRLKQMQPEYPPRLFERGIEGDVTVNIHIDKNGEPSSVDVIKASAHSELNVAAKKAAMRDVYAPATKDGVAVEHDLIFVYRFRVK